MQSANVSDSEGDAPYIHNKLYQDAAKMQVSRDEKKAVNYEEMMAECTFNPTLVSKTAKNDARTFDQFYQS